jgi:hypothetical protein
LSTFYLLPRDTLNLQPSMLIFLKIIHLSCNINCDLIIYCSYTSCQKIAGCLKGWVFLIWNPACIFLVMR